jgi:hypothetical protein
MGVEYAVKTFWCAWWSERKFLMGWKKSYPWTLTRVVYCDLADVRNSLLFDTNLCLTYQMMKVKKHQQLRINNFSGSYILEEIIFWLTNHKIITNLNDFWMYDRITKVSSATSKLASGRGKDRSSLTSEWRKRGRLQKILRAQQRF